MNHPNQSPPDQQDTYIQKGESGPQIRRQESYPDTSVICKSLTMITEFGQIYNSSIISIATTEHHICTINSSSHLKQYSIKMKTLTKDYNQVFSYTSKSPNEVACCVIACSNDSVFVTSMTGVMVQINLIEESPVRNFGKIHTRGISAICITLDKAQIFTADEGGSLLQHNISTGMLVRNYGNIHSGKIYSICCITDVIFTSDENGNQKVYNYNTFECIKNFDNVCDQRLISVIHCTPDQKFLFLADAWGGIKQFDTQDFSLVQDYGEVIQYGVTCMCSCSDSSNLFIADDEQNIKQYQISQSDGGIFSQVYKRLFIGKITSFAVYGDLLFIADSLGFLKEFCMLEKELICDGDGCSNCQVF